MANLADSSWLQRFFACLLGATLVVSVSVPMAQTGINIATTPLFLTASVPPLVMLSLSNDHQLYFAAYPDYADLDGNGLAERTYNHAIDYYGYFDSYKCYTYSASRFQPSSITADKYCSGGLWSGNFLNYLSMSRIDTIRKILYGGYRSTDTATQTVLERSYLPNEAHSWVRYYDGTDIANLTPFSLPQTTITTSSDSRQVPNGSLTNTKNDQRTFTTASWNSSDHVQIGDQILITSRAFPNTVWMKGVVTSFTASSRSVQVQVTSSAGVGTTRNDWNLVNQSRRGISFCNTTAATSGTFSQNVTDPPLIRVAKGNYSLWTSNERHQCRWSDEVSRSGHDQMTIGTLKFSNGNTFSATEIPANADNPVRTEVGLGQQNYVVRVEACVAGLEHKETCQTYPSDNKKPVGLLQLYGESADKPLYFGLMTGSYMKNKSGGVLRRNIENISNEINVSTDGTFRTPPTSGAIISSLNRLRIYGYRHHTATGNDDGTYNSSASGGDNCPWGLSSFNNGRCTNWGNPQSEIFLESLRYFAGKNPLSAFSVSGTDRISSLPSLTSWSDPLNNNNWCATLSIINFNSSVPSYDSDQLTSVTDIKASSASALTDTVGEGEGIHGNSWFVGTSGTATNQLCTAKTITSLGNVTGTCPDAPRLEGGYNVAGLAHHAYTETIRDDLTDSDGNPVDVQVKTYAVSLAPAVPRLEIPRPGGATPAVTLLPACRNDTVGGNCAIVDFKIIEQDNAAGKGAVLVQWEDSEQGGDYDMDMNGVIKYTITNTSINVQTNVFSQSTPNTMGFGYIISGTTQDGFHAHSGINSYSRSDSSGVPGCSNCVYNNSPTSHTYTLGGSSAASLENPLYYAAKWGGFDKALHEKRLSDGLTGFPDYRPTWDKGSGLPSNYFFAVDPKELFDGLSAALDDILWRSEASSTAAATSSAVLQTDTLLYTASFRSDDWSGTIEAHEINADGTKGNKKWDAEQKLHAMNPTDRNIFTKKSDGTTIPLLWSSLASSQQDALAINPPTVTTVTGQDRVAWLRGVEHADLRDRTGGGIIRRIGDLVSSDPQFMYKRDFGYSLIGGTEGSAYRTYRESSTYRNRPDVLFVGSNGGMLHAFHAGTPYVGTPLAMDTDGGKELFAYLPSELLAAPTGTAAPINELMAEDYSHRFYVDGTPTVSDAYISGSWKTVLVGTMGVGGRTVFALDVTDPENFTTSDVLWEFSHAELGAGVTKPVIARLADGTWVAIVGNGYNSQSHTAQLFVIRLSDGHLLHRIDTGIGSAMNPNGLATPEAIDWPALNLNASLVYAGDLQGNLWRFNLTGTPSATKLFTATDSSGTPGAPQPITAKPALALMTGNPQGIVVSFGTGSYFRSMDDDMTSPQTQTLYGIFDTVAGESGIVRGDLLEQSITPNTAAVTIGTTVYPINTLRKVSKNPLTTAHKGWFLDLPATGERVISEPTFPSGSVQRRLRFTTLIPDEDPCGSGRNGFLMDIDLLTGGSYSSSVFDLDGDGQFNASDEWNGDVVSGIGGVTGERITVIRKSDSDIDYLYAGDGDLVGRGKNMSGPVGRQSWHQLR